MTPVADPQTITIPPERQRSQIETADLEESIARRGQIMPIVVTRDFVLVAGQRRLTACRNLNLEVKYVFSDTLDPDELFDIELEENIKRVDLPWQDQVKAITALHTRRSGADPHWTHADTANFLGFSAAYVGQVLAVASVMSDERISTAATLAQAISIYRRLSERKAASLVSDILTNVGTLFKSSAPKEDPVEPIHRPSDSPPASTAVSLPVRRDPAPIHPSVSVEQVAAPTAALPPLSPPTVSGPTVSPPIAAPAVICADFIEWAKTYSGPKFNLIHCDFPYGVSITGNFGLLEGGNAGNGARRTWEDLNQPPSTVGVYENDPKIYWNLTDAFIENFDRFASYSCHVIFWFSMNFYEQTRRKLEGIGLHVFPHPFIWHHTNGQGMTIHHGMLKRLYDVAFLCVRNDRPFIKQLGNCYGAPTILKSVHPSQKPDGMLQHLFTSFVDSTSRVLDPTCGSGSALWVADDLGAESILGLELNPEHAESALAQINNRRRLRQLSGAL